MGRPKKGTSPYKPGSHRYFVRETVEMRGLMALGHERWPEIKSDGEIIRRYMSYGGQCLALMERVDEERANKRRSETNKRGKDGAE